MKTAASPKSLRLGRQAGSSQPCRHVEEEEDQKPGQCYRSASDLSSREHRADEGPRNWRLALITGHLEGFPSPLWTRITVEYVPTRISATDLARTE